jgi:hypothetical protein
LIGREAGPPSGGSRFCGAAGPGYDELAAQAGGDEVRGTYMCLKGKKKVKEKPGNFRCKRCGATSKKKKDICKPKKIR